MSSKLFKKMDLLSTYSPKQLSILSAVAAHVKEVLFLPSTVEELMENPEYLHKCVSKVRVKWQAISKEIGITGREAYRWYNEVHVRKLFRGIMTQEDRQALQEIILQGIYDRSILLPNFRKIARSKLCTDYPLQIFTMTYNNLLRSKTVREALIYERVLLPMRTLPAKLSTSTSAGADLPGKPGQSVQPIYPSLQAAPVKQGATTDPSMYFQGFPSMPPVPPPHMAAPHMIPPPSSHINHPFVGIEAYQAQSWPNPFAYNMPMDRVYPYSYPYPYPFPQSEFAPTFVSDAPIPSLKNMSIDNSTLYTSAVHDMNSSCSGNSFFDEVVNKSDSNQALLASSAAHGDSSGSSYDHIHV